MSTASPAPPAPPHQQGAVLAPLPRITIQFCTQCKWMLRAAYYAQELLSTFSLSLGEVALQPSTGGTFIVTIYHPSSPPTSSSEPPSIQSTVLWNRKTDEGFPETKELKRRVRDVIEPGRDLGHVDRDHRRPAAAAVAAAMEIKTAAPAEGDAKKEDKEAEKKQDSAASAASGAGVVCEDCN